MANRRGSLRRHLVSGPRGLVPECDSHWDWIGGVRVADDAAESVPQVAWPLFGVFVKARLAGLKSWALVRDHLDVRNRGPSPDCLDPLLDWVTDKDGKREVRHSLVG